MIKSPQDRPQILVINKPVGVTSHDVVDEVRRITGVKKVGHAGTLDPSATGVLVVLVGRQATKLSDKLRGEDKEYILTMEFGRATDTLDADGEVVEKLEIRNPKLETLTQEKIEEVLDQFRGTYEQKVPLYSAVRVGGVKLYDIARGQKKESDARLPARQGFRVPIRKVKIKELGLLEFQPADDHHYPAAKLRTVVSSGTYTRALVRDIGEALGIPTHQTLLVRTRAGEFTLEEAQELAEVTADDIIQLNSC